MKYTPVPVVSGYNSEAVLNQNFSDIAAALTDQLSRAPAVPNSMDVDIDLDSNDILNAGRVNTTYLVLDGTPVAHTTALVPPIDATDVTYTPEGGSITDVAAALALGTEVPAISDVLTFLSTTTTADAVDITGYASGWAATVAGPVGGFKLHKTGGTNLVPTTGTAVAVACIGGGDGTGVTTGQAVQAGYYWDAAGDEWFISEKEFSVAMFGATGTGDETESFQDAAYVARYSKLRLEPGESYTVSAAIVIQDCDFNLRGSTITFSPSGAVMDLDVRSNSIVRNGVLVNTGTSPSGAGQYQCPVTIGNYGVGTGYSNIVLNDLTIESNRPNGNGIFVTGDSHNIAIKRIKFPAGSNIGRPILIHWGGASTPSSGTYHPHNITIDDIEAASLSNTSSDSAVVFLSSVFNTKVSNIKCSDASIRAAIIVFAGDYGNYYAQSEYKADVMKGVVIDGVEAEFVSAECSIVKVDCRSTLAPSNSDFQCPDIVRANGTGVGATTTDSGFSIAKCYGGSVTKSSASGFYHGVSVGEGVKQLGVNTTEASGNQYSGIYVSNGSEEPEDCIIEYNDVYGNNLVAGSNPGVYAGSSVRTVVRNNNLGRASETQTHGLRAVNSATGLVVTGNYCEDATSVAYSIGSSTDYDILDVFSDNESGSGVTHYSGANIIPYMKETHFSQVHRRFIGTAAPSAGVWEQGDTVYDVTPTASGTMGWVCTSAGDFAGSAPTFKTFGSIAA